VKLLSRGGDDPDKRHGVNSGVVAPGGPVVVVVAILDLVDRRSSLLVTKTAIFVVRGEEIGQVPRQAGPVLLPTSIIIAFIVVLVVVVDSHRQEWMILVQHKGYR
jgi:hypothetical protein